MGGPAGRGRRRWFALGGRRQAARFEAAELGVGPGARVLVVAPHCDDETLGAGGLLYLAARAGLPVRIAMVTNGDGFNRYAVRGRYRRLRLSPAQYIEFAYLRQRETLEALRELGLEPAAVTFLGYPDRGLAHLWEGHWDPAFPYRSTFTRCTHSPYANSRTPGAPFAGRCLVEDLKVILREERPSHLAVPHPNDSHPDHWAACCFTLYALEELRAEGETFPDQTQVLGYLIHRGTWPRPRGLRPRLLLEPPAALAAVGTPWTSLPLPPEAVRAKLHALFRYRSQLAFMRRYLLSFVRSNELFGLFKPLAVPAVPPGRILVDGEAHDWVAGSYARVLDPVQRIMGGRVGRGGGVRSLASCRDRDNLYLFMELSRRAPEGSLHELTLYGVAAGPAGPVRRRLRLGLRAPDRMVVHGDGRWNPMGLVVGRTRDHCLEVAVPLHLLDGAQWVLVGLESRYRPWLVERTSWQMLQLGPIPEQGAGGRREGEAAAEEAAG